MLASLRAQLARQNSHQLSDSCLPLLTKPSTTNVTIQNYTCFSFYVECLCGVLKRILVYQGTQKSASHWRSARGFS